MARKEIYVYVCQEAVVNRCQRASCNFLSMIEKYRHCAHAQVAVGLVAHSEIADNGVDGYMD